ncbi:hypothetical protein QFZ36_002973 [Pseudarthrobacter siccitolerans]|uniref:Uncharacterized protein n=1 Tax=Pseudarthrobacter siccitolerans TaxID=861266 RepID=A0ABU0PNX6_9MICC|nr:hypothetical protein [Pseudarthrobacter siccitolerans]MDQ0675412.1 hypothetical protein [Pseudarthrobacter siccitolerans]
MHSVSFPGNLFFDPLATGLVTSAPTSQFRGNESDGAATPARRRATQTAAEQKALRAASLVKVSRDLDRMVRERMR